MSRKQAVVLGQAVILLLGVLAGVGLGVGAQRVVNGPDESPKPVAPSPLAAPRAHLPAIPLEPLLSRWQEPQPQATRPITGGTADRPQTQPQTQTTPPPAVTTPKNQPEAPKPDEYEPAAPGDPVS